MMIRYHMHENLDLLRAVEKLLLRDNLADATALARAIAESPDEPGLGKLGTQATKVRELAADLARAPSVDEACRRVARMAVACASCHTATGVTPELSTVSVLPADKPTLDARMARHVWATDHLWAGIIGGGDEPWTKGLDVLAATPLPFRVTLDDRAGLASQLQALAVTARKRVGKDDLTERGRVYGEILAVCTSCHASPTRGAVIRRDAPRAPAPAPARTH